MVKIEILHERPVCISIGESIIHTGDYDIYEGEYTVIPRAEAQILATADKVMERNVNVEEIPFQAVANPAGGTTISIAS